MNETIEDETETSGLKCWGLSPSLNRAPHILEGKGRGEEGKKDGAKKGRNAGLGRGRVGPLLSNHFAHC